jgi:(E)-4-hydroxy-3-methylbut-2-enyl-diphosphate synthase
MADADFGYVGSGPGKIDLYVGKKRVKSAIPENDAVDQLVQLIQEEDKWIAP